METPIEKCREFLTEAQQRYREAFTENPNDHVAAKCLGDAFFMMGELEDGSAAEDFFDSAAKQYATAMKMCPSLEVPRINLLPTKHSKQLAPEQLLSDSSAATSAPSASQSGSAGTE